MTVADINAQVITLWKDHFGTAREAVHWPMLSPEPLPDGLTVVGCNPALPKSRYYVVPLFKPNLGPGPNIQELINHEICARKSYPYYRPSISLADELGLHF